MGDDKLPDPIKKTKKKAKRACKCSVGWGLLGIICLVVGIALLVSFAEFWADDENWRRGLAYAGVAFVIVGVLMLGVGITLCVVLIIIWRRLSGDHTPTTMFKPPNYEYGKAPYPQQPPFNPDPQTVPMATEGEPPQQPSAPPSQEKPPASQGDVQVEIAEHHKF